MIPTVSIIVPVYNAEKTLRRCVESIVHGQMKNIEIILVDDCSKDGSWKICKELEEEFLNVLCVKNKQNKGVSFTRNEGILKSRGKWIMFVDSDDWVSTNYVSKLLESAEHHYDALNICGFHFFDYINKKKVDYVFNSNQNEEYIEISGKNLFTLIDRILLQNVWNKIFNRDIICSQKIKFNELENIGEDFRFVLDYMEAAGLKKCNIINEALYYYVKMSEASLMSDFGWNTNNQAFFRLEQLARICGKNQEILEILEKQKEKQRENIIYHIVRCKGKSRVEKINRINDILEVSNAKQYYNKQVLLVYKEIVIKLFSSLIQLKEKIKMHISTCYVHVLINKERRKLKNRGFSIISQNCIGGVFYHDMKMKFLSPTINLFFKEPDFIKFVLNIEYYLNLDIEVYWNEEYPVGKLGDIHIFFMHYNSCKEARDAWNKRKKRVNLNKLFIIATDRDGFNDNVYKLWQNIKYKKILLTVKEKYRNKDAIVFKKYDEDNCVPDLIPHREFYKDDQLINILNTLKEGD